MKVERVETFNHVMRCEICKEEMTSSHHPFTPQAMTDFIQDHVNLCKASDLVSFALESRMVGIMSKPCEFCQAEGGEYRFGVYCCGACEVVLHRVKQ